MDWADKGKRGGGEGKVGRERGKEKGGKEERREEKG